MDKYDVKLILKKVQDFLFTCYTVYKEKKFYSIYLREKKELLLMESYILRLKRVNKRTSGFSRKRIQKVGTLSFSEDDMKMMNK
jgi:hypothetical protein